MVANYDVTTITVIGFQQRELVLIF